MNPFLILLIILTSVGLSLKAELKINFILYDVLDQSVTGPVEVKITDNVERICNDMGVQQPSNYTIRIWGSNTSYLAYQKSLWGTSFPGSTGYVMGPREMGLLNVTGLAENAEHEFAHSMSLIVNSSISNNPRWFWETVAIYESGEFRDPTTISYLINDNFPTIQQLDNGFNTGSRQIYEVGYLIGEFIVEKWGSDKLVEMIKKNGNTQSVFGLSQVEFGTQWAEFVKEKYFKPLTVEGQNQNTIRIYPNPASDYVFISPLNVGDVKVLIYDLTGKMVLNVSPVNSATNISALKKGIYFFNIVEAKKTTSFRLVKN
jgi:hypothetical protein